MIVFTPCSVMFEQMFSINQFGFEMSESFTKYLTTFFFEVLQLMDGLN